MQHSHIPHLAVPLSVRVSPEVRDELEALADATGRTKSFLAAEAIRAYLSTQAWQITAIENAVKKSKSKKAKFYDHAEISDWLETWGTKTSRKPPK